MTTSPEGSNDVKSTENEQNTNEIVPGEVDIDIHLAQNDELLAFLEENDLFDMKDKVLSSRLKLSHFKLIEKADLNDLCQEINLSVSQKIRLKHAITALQKHSSKPIEKKSIANIRSKIVIVGEASVGKTTLQKALMGWEFEKGSKATFAVNSLHKKSTVNYKKWNVNIDYELIDTPGLQRFADIITLYLRGALAVIVVYDIVNKVSFEKAKWWIEYIESNASGYDKIILIANKIDMKNGTKGASQEDIKEDIDDDDDENEIDSIKAGQIYATQHNISFLEISAMYKENVDVLLQWLRKQSKLQIKANPKIIEAKQQNIRLDQVVARDANDSNISKQFINKMGNMKCCGFV